MKTPPTQQIAHYTPHIYHRHTLYKLHNTTHIHADTTDTTDSTLHTHNYFPHLAHTATTQYHAHACTYRRHMQLGHATHHACTHTHTFHSPCFKGKVLADI